MRTRDGQLLSLVAAAFLLADAAILWIGFTADFAFDFTCCYQQAADRALSDPSALYAWSDTYTFRYTPIGAIIFTPLVPFDEVTATWLWLGFKLAVLGLTAAWFSARWSRSGRRWLIAVLVLSFPPIVHDLVIGNVSTFTVLVLLAVARWRDVRGGVAIGFLMVLMPKPHLLPVLAYLAVRRPHDFVAAVATMATGVAIGLAAFGLEPWIAFVGSLREPLERTFTANIGFSGLLGPAGVVVGLVIGLAVVAAGIAGGGARGYGLTIIGGILIGPYTFIHYLSSALVAAEPVLITRPRRLAPFAWLLVIFPLIPVWLTALAAVVYASPRPSDRAEEAELRAAVRG